MASAEEQPLKQRVRAWIRRNAWWIVPALGVLYILVWWLVPLFLYRYTGTDKAAKLEAITGTRTALLAGLIGVGALLAFWLNSRVYRLTEQGHITERYTKAIEQLGGTELAVRLGGIYALERLAHDSPERDHPTVVEVLSAFVREESRKQGIRRQGHRTAQEAAEETDSMAPVSDTKPRPMTDIQAAFTVLGRLPRSPDIPRGDLAEAQLSGARLEGANLSGAQFYEADLSWAELDGADLSGAQLVWANLEGAHLDNANLSDANLLGARLVGAHLDKANLSGAKLLGTNLSDAHLTWANLSGAVLAGNLSGALLYGADLSGAQLDDANLSGAGLSGADLREAVGLRQAQLDAAWGDGETRLPDGMRRPAGWTSEDDLIP